MANIKLSEIPNAPQAVNNYSLNPQFSGDQVGNEAKSDIARGFQGQMQDTQNAGLIGRSIAGLGNDITSSAGNFSSAALYYKKGKDRQAEAEGFSTYYGNKTAIEDEYYSRINDPNNPIPIESRAGIWMDVTQKGQRFLQGMPPEQQQAYGVEATKDFYAGVTAASNEVHALKKQEFATKQLTTYQTAMTGLDWDNAKIAVATGVKTGAFSPEEGARMDTSIRTNQQYHGLIDKMYADKTGTLFKSIMATGEQGATLKDAPDVSPENLVKVGKIGEAIYNQDLWANNVEQFKAQIVSKEIIDPNQLKGNKRFYTMPEPQQAAVLAYLTNNRAGTQEGEVYSSAGQNLVDIYPKDKNNKSNELLEYKTWILGNVPEPAASVQIDALDKKYAEMVNNGGNLKPETEVSTNLSRGVNAYLKGQMFGDYTESPTDSLESQSSTKAADAANSVKDQVMKGGKIGNTTYPSGPPATSHEAYQRLESAMQKRIQASDANELFKKKEQHGAIWKFFHPSAPASASSSELPQNKTTMSFSTPIGRVTSYGYKGDTTPDTNSSAGIGAFTKHLIAGQSFGTSYDIEQKLRDSGIKPNDKVELTLSNGEKVVKIWHDRGATPEQARKLGLRNYSGRFDFYSPDGPDKRSDLAVVGFKKVTGA